MHEGDFVTAGQMVGGGYGLAERPEARGRAAPKRGAEPSSWKSMGTHSENHESVRTAMQRTSNRGLCLYRLRYSLPARRVLASAIALFWVGCGKSSKPKPPPPDVEVVRVEQKDVPIWKEWIGTLDGLVNAQIKPQVTGYLLRQTVQGRVLS